MEAASLSLDASPEMAQADTDASPDIMEPDMDASSDIVKPLLLCSISGARGLEYVNATLATAVADARAGRHKAQAKKRPGSTTSAHAPWATQVSVAMAQHEARSECVAVTADDPHYRFAPTFDVHDATHDTLLNQPLVLSLSRCARAKKRAKSRERKRKKDDGGGGGDDDEPTQDHWQEPVLVGTVHVDLLPFFQGANVIQGWHPIVPVSVEEDEKHRSRPTSAKRAATPDTPGQAELYLSLTLTTPLLSEDQVSRGSVVTLGMGRIDALPASWLDHDEETQGKKKKKKKKKKKQLQHQRKKATQEDVPDADTVHYVYEAAMVLTDDLCLEARTDTMQLPPLVVPAVQEDNDQDDNEDTPVKPKDRAKRRKQREQEERLRQEAAQRLQLARRFVAWNTSHRFFVEPDTWQTLGKACQDVKEPLTVDLTITRVRIETRVLRDKKHDNLEAQIPYGTSRVVDKGSDDPYASADADVLVTEVADPVCGRARIVVGAKGTCLPLDATLSADPAALQQQKEDARAAATRALEERAVAKEEAAAAAATKSRRASKHGRSIKAAVSRRASVVEEPLVTPDEAADAVVDEWTSTRLSSFVWLSRPLQVREPPRVQPRDFIEARVPHQVPWPSPQTEFLTEVRRIIRGFADKYASILQDGEEACDASVLRDRFYHLLNSTGDYRTFKEQLKPSIIKVYRALGFADATEEHAKLRSYTVLHSHLSELVNTAMNELLPAYAQPTIAASVPSAPPDHQGISGHTFVDSHGRSPALLQSLAVDAELLGRPYAADACHRERVRLGGRKLEAEDYRAVTDGGQAPTRSPVTTEVASYWYDYAVFCFREVGVDMVMREAGGVALQHALACDVEHVPSLLAYGAFLLERFTIRRNTARHGHDASAVHVDADQAWACFTAAADVSPEDPLPVALQALWCGICGDPGKSARIMCRAHAMNESIQEQQLLQQQQTSPPASPRRAALPVTLGCSIVSFSPLFDGSRVFSLPSRQSLWARDALSVRERMSMYLLSIHSSHLAEFVLREVVTGLCSKDAYVTSDPSLSGRIPSLVDADAWAAGGAVPEVRHDDADVDPHHPELKHIEDFVEECLQQNAPSPGPSTAEPRGCFVPRTLSPVHVATSQRDIDILTQCARLEHQRDDLDCALRALNAVSVRALDPRQVVDACAYRGHVHFERGEMVDALRMYEACLDWNTESVDPLVLVRVSHLHHQQREYARSRDVALMLVAALSSEGLMAPSGLLAVGISCLGLAGFDRDVDGDVSLAHVSRDGTVDHLAHAERALTEANRLDNRDSTTWAYLTALCLLQGRARRADWCYEQVRALGLRDAALHRAIGRLYLERGLIRGAESATRCAMEAASTVTKSARVRATERSARRRLGVAEDEVDTARSSVLAADVAHAEHAQADEIALLERAIEQSAIGSTGASMVRMAAEDRLRGVYDRATMVVE